MATTLIQVSPEQLDNAAKTISGMAVDYETLYKQLLSEVEGMKDVTWGGADAEAYIAQVKSFEDDFIKMFNLMNDYANFLTKSANAYRTTQGNVKDLAAKLTIDA